MQLHSDGTEVFGLKISGHTVYATGNLSGLGGGATLRNGFAAIDKDGSILP